MTDKLVLVNEAPEGLFSLEDAELILRAPETIAAFRAEENGERLAAHILAAPVKVIRDAFRLRPLAAFRPVGSKTRGVELYSIAEIESAYRTAVDFSSR